MKYTCCHWIHSGILFRRNQVRFCAYEHLQSEGENVIFSDYNGEIIDYDKYFEIKNRYIELCKKEEFHPNCKNCIYLFENDWSEEDYIDHITFDHWLMCNSNCLYCGQTLLPKNEKIQYYDAYPVIDDMRKNGILKATETSCIVFGGGEPTLLSEFDKLMSLFLNEGFKNIRINSSGIKYSRMLAEALKNKAASLVISIDAGSEEIHEKIKRVKSFDTIMNNINRYINYAGTDSEIILKYIIMPGINDSESEINKFFENIKVNNVKKTALAIEAGWYHDFYPEFPQKIYDLFDCFLEKAKNFGIETEYICETESMLKCRKDCK